MALTNTSLRALLKAALHNDANFSDPDDLNTFLTLGQERIVKDSPHTLGAKEGSISVVADTRTYSLASDFYQMRSVFYATNGYHLTPIGVNEFVETVERLPTIPSGAPQGYCITVFSASGAAWTIAFDHIPDASYTYKYWYYWKPIDITGTATAPMSTIGFAELMVTAATMIARERNDPEGHAIAALAYQEQLKAYKAFNPQGPDYLPVRRPDYGPRRGGSTLQLPSSYPS